MLYPFVSCGVLTLLNLGYARSPGRLVEAVIAGDFHLLKSANHIQSVTVTGHVVPESVLFFIWYLQGQRPPFCYSRMTAVFAKFRMPTSFSL